MNWPFNFSDTVAHPKSFRIRWEGPYFTVLIHIFPDISYFDFLVGGRKRFFLEGGQAKPRFVHFFNAYARYFFRYAGNLFLIDCPPPPSRRKKVKNEANAPTPFTNQVLFGQKKKAKNSWEQNVFLLFSCLHCSNQFLMRDEEVGAKVAHLLLILVSTLY